MNTNINFVDLKRQYSTIKSEVQDAISRVLDDTAFAAGPYVKEFETNFARAHGVGYCVGVNSGTSALHMAMMALNIGAGDEVIVPTNTFFATAEAVSLAGATPVFVDCEEKFYNINYKEIENAITKKTKAVIAVHLYGQSANLDEIKTITNKYNLHLIEDCAQAHLAEYKGRMVGGDGIISCFSFYPGKNLGAYGEAGAVLTNNEELYSKCLALRDHGSKVKYYHDYIGHNYRMEGIQGAVLNVKLKHLNKWTDLRRRNASLYVRYLEECKEIILPQESLDAKHVYHLFVIRERSASRDKLMKYLAERKIFTGIHYPIPCHLQKAYAHLEYKKGAITGVGAGAFKNAERFAEEIISLPMYAELTEEEVKYVSTTIKGFYE
ncbi:MAG: DegT/DnrJ/EryC1/StrS family aminotransferase [Oligoflexia bacterium]|nr:DegT/DnrJ/EryC1/StrS family aminotransferase [Oligoflexia bacterium]